MTTVTFEITQEEMTALTACASAHGVDIQTVLHSLVAALARPPTSGNMAAASGVQRSPLASPPLLERGAETDAPEEQAERAREAVEMGNNIRRWREEQKPGAGLL